MSDGPAEGLATNFTATTPASAVSADAVTFVCCIEHGRLEAQTVLMLRSLRANAGRLSGARVLAVVGRRGAPLAKSTLAALQRLGVELVRDRRANPAPWFNYANKIAAVTLGERIARTPTIVWLDSDVLIAAEPTGLLLAPGEDFAGRCEFLPPAVLREDPAYMPYWERLCTLLGTDFERLPTLHVTEHVDADMRLFFNSGVFAWRRGSAFAPAYRRAFVRLLRSRLAQYDGNFFTADQVVLSPVVIAHGLHWRHLHVNDHLMVFQGQIDSDIAAPHMGAAHVLHYSQSLQPAHRGRFLRRLSAELPALHRQLAGWEQAAEASLQTPVPPLVRALARGWTALRGLRWRWYQARVRRAPLGSA